MHPFLKSFLSVYSLNYTINGVDNAMILIVFYMAIRYTSIKYSGLFFGGFYGKYFEVTGWN